jgi:hypothetical protein
LNVGGAEPGADALPATLPSYGDLGLSRPKKKRRKQNR